MADRYQQFLGSNPGTIVELVDDSGSPYSVRTESGFEFYISADDFRNYYRRVGEAAPPKWRPMLTDPEKGFVNSAEMAELMDVVRGFEKALQQFDKARSFARDALRALEEEPKTNLEQLKLRLNGAGWQADFLTAEDVRTLKSLAPKIRDLLLSDSCAVIPLFDSPPGANGDRTESGKAIPGAKTKAAHTKGLGEASALKGTAAKTRQPRMKNVELEVEGDKLTVSVDLSKEFGPSKSGKTVIIASTVGNKRILGREERIGLNVYKDQGKKGARGSKKEFKNIGVSVEGDALTLSVDLSKDLGPSKSGQTILVASTGGNQLVFGREEKIGLNIYRPLS